MPIRRCELCKFTATTNYKFDRHIASARHIEKCDVTLSINMLSCDKCSKTYKHRSGLWRHAQKCNINIVVKSPEDRIIELENEIVQLKSTGSQVTNQIEPATQSTTTTIKNTKNINTKNHPVINYLNTHCPNVIPFKEFVSKIILTPEEMMKLLTVNYDKFVTQIIVNRLEQLPKMERPIHCIISDDCVPNAFAVKGDHQWKEEKGKELENFIETVEEDDEYNKMEVPQSLDTINHIIFDTYKEIAKENPEFEKIENKMFRCGGTIDKFDIIYNLFELPGRKLVLETTDGQL